MKLFLHRLVNPIASRRAMVIVPAMRTIPLCLIMLAGLVSFSYPGVSQVMDMTSRLSAPNTTAVIAECTRIGHKLGSVSRKSCLDIQLSESGARSVKGQAILMKEYPPVAGSKPVGRILLIGGVHGDEYAAVSIGFRWLDKLERYHSGLFHWHVAPLVNPDGLLQRHSQRLNAHGIDLNRNMPTPDWYKKTERYWLNTGKDPRRYPGLAPLSEPESVWLFDEIRRFQPDAIVTIHAPFGVLDFDGPPKGPDELGFLHLKVIGTYPGSLGNWAGVQHRIPVITVELPYA
ncbi:MAG: M14 family zinc carboxypeptidase, partial [Mariprofundus sp.]